MITTTVGNTTDNLNPAPISDAASRLQQTILTRQARLGIVGMGYVGMPLAVVFAEAGYDVVGLEVDAARVDAVNAGTSHVADASSAKVKPLVECGRLRATTDMRQLADVDVVITCVPTPLSRTKDPDITHVVDASSHIASSLRRGQLIILESTTYPGTTREIVLPRLEATGLRVGEDFFLAYSPERVDPGNTQFTVRNTPKVVGGIDEASTELAALVYSQVVDAVVPVSSPEAAEMAKLLENTFRGVNIALANEMALMCDRLGLNVWEIIDAAATKPFGFMKFSPGPGVGGHCIPLDPAYLSWKMKTLDYRARFIELASEINAEMPFHVLAKIVDGLNVDGKSVKGSNILILGVAYKPNVDDTRESPALGITMMLREKGAHVVYSDPHVPLLNLPTVTLESRNLTPDLLRSMDCVVVITDHDAMDYAMVAAHSKLVVDTRNAVPVERCSTRIITL